MENKELNLVEILKGCEGIKLYATMYGYVILSQVFDEYFIITFIDNEGEETFIKFLPNGTITNRFDAECLIFPSKDQRDWSKFERPIPVDTPMVCCLKENNYSLDFRIRYYKGLEKGKHKVYDDGFKSTTIDYSDSGNAWEIMIPFNKFNPNDIEESLKYNIQKL